MAWRSDKLILCDCYKCYVAMTSNGHKGKLGELQFYFRKIPLQSCINKNFWWAPFFL